MPLDPRLWEMLYGHDPEEAALAEPRFGGPNFDYPDFRPEDLREVAEPELSFPEQADERSSFGSRFLDTFADSPTNYQAGPGQSPLMIALASAMNSGSRGLQQRRLRERENSPSNPANKLSLARLNATNAKTRLEQKRYQSAENRATRNERRADRTLARLEAGAEKAAMPKPPVLTPEQKGVSDAARIMSRNRWLRVNKERAPGDLAPKAPPKPKEYVRDKVAQAKASGMTAAQFEAQVRAAADKLKASGFNPDSLIDAGYRSLKGED